MGFLVKIFNYFLLTEKILNFKMVIKVRLGINLYKEFGEKMETVKFHGKIIEVIERQFGDRTFEIARRSPGVRALIVKDDKILLSREYRTETESYDYRLPGGKVFDRLDDFALHLSEDLLPYAKEAVCKEVYEEVGLRAKNPKLIKISKAGATVCWDLYYFEIREFEEDVQHLEDGEDITFAWHSIEEVLELCKNNLICEDRSLGVLLNFILTNFKGEVEKAL